MGKINRLIFGHLLASRGLQLPMGAGELELFQGADGGSQGGGASSNPLPSEEGTPMKDFKTSA